MFVFGFNRKPIPLANNSQKHTIDLIDSAEIMRKLWRSGELIHTRKGTKMIPYSFQWPKLLKKCFNISLRYDPEDSN